MCRRRENDCRGGQRHEQEAAVVQEGTIEAGSPPADPRDGEPGQAEEGQQPLAPNRGGEPAWISTQADSVTTSWRPRATPAPLSDEREAGRKRCADEQALGVGVGAVVEPCQRRSLMEAQRHPEARGDSTGAGQPEDGSSTPPEAEDSEEDERPDQVELLLDRQAPGVGQRRGRCRGDEIVGSLDDEVPVGNVEDRPQGIAAEVRVAATSRSEPDEERTEAHHEEQRRQEASGPSRPERDQGDGFGVAKLLDQKGGDEEAREHEEAVDAEEAGWQPGDPSVVEEHTDDREGSNAVETWQVADTLAARGHVGIFVRANGPLSCFEVQAGHAAQSSGRKPFGSAIDFDLQEALEPLGSELTPEAGLLEAAEGSGEVEARQALTHVGAGAHLAGNPETPVVVARADRPAEPVVGVVGDRAPRRRRRRRG